METDLAFQRYRLLAWIGRGGMSEVFLAGWEHATGMHRLAVMKRLNEDLCHDPITVQMFLDEARLGLRLNHANVVQTHDVGRFEGRPCILMEYLKGQPLHELAARVHDRGGVLPLELLVKIIVDVLDGLSAAHEATDYDGTPLCVVHRDISPHNLFIEYDGRVKVLDFGIAKAAIHEGQTRTGLVKGKFAYMAPEQARSEHVDHRADIWSVGVVLWELLTGARLFKGATEAAMLHSTLTAVVPYPAAYRSDVPPVIENVVHKALERDPSHRFGSAREMKQELESWLQAQGNDFSSELAAYMAQEFAPERNEQQEFLRELLGRREVHPTSSGMLPRVGPPPFADFTHVSHLSRLVQAPETELVRGLRRKNRLVLWALLGLVGLLVGLTVGVTIVMLRPTSQTATGSVAAANRAPASLPGSGGVAAESEANRAPVPDGEPTSTGPEVEPWEQSESAATNRAPGSGTRIRRPPSPPSKSSHEAVLPAVKNSPAASGSVAATGDGMGYLTLDTTPWSIVSVGGRILGQTPIVRATLPPGDTVLSLSNPESGLRISYPVRIEAGRTTVRRIGLE